MSIETLCDLFYNFSLYEKDHSPLTIKRHRQVLQFYCKHAHITDISQINLDNVRELFYYGRIERSWSANTYLNYHKTFTVFFRWCLERGYMDTNPIKQIEKPKLQRNLPKGLTPRETQLILRTVKEQAYNKFLHARNCAIFATLIYTGIRKQELLNLKLADVDLDVLSLYIRQGKGGKDRIIPINRDLARVLSRYLERRERAWKTCAEFFVCYTYDMGLRSHGFVLLIKQISEMSGIKFTAHTLRHTFATMMIEGGCDIYSISKFLGHNDIKTTTIYLNATVQHLRGEMTKHPLKFKW